MPKRTHRELRKGTRKRTNCQVQCWQVRYQGAPAMGLRRKVRPQGHDKGDKSPGPEEPGCSLKKDKASTSLEWLPHLPGLREAQGASQGVGHRDCTWRMGLMGLLDLLVSQNQSLELTLKLRREPYRNRGQHKKITSTSCVK